MAEQPTASELIRSSLVIAAGSEYETRVFDLRALRDWRKGFGGGPVDMENREIIWHHTASAGTRLSRIKHQIARMEVECQGSPYGLPYNFVVWPGRQPRAYYLNDLDQTSPHTRGHNHHSAIAFWGNYEHEVPELAMVGLGTRLADAIATMWARYVPESLHRDYTATVCPGKNLVPYLDPRTMPF